MAASLRFLQHANPASSTYFSSNVTHSATVALSVDGRTGPSQHYAVAVEGGEKELVTFLREDGVVLVTGETSKYWPKLTQPEVCLALYINKGPSDVTCICICYSSHFYEEHEMIIYDEPRVRILRLAARVCELLFASRVGTRMYIRAEGVRKPEWDILRLMHSRSGCSVTYWVSGCQVRYFLKEGVPADVGVDRVEMYVDPDEKLPERVPAAPPISVYCKDAESVRAKLEAAGAKVDRQSEGLVPKWRIV